jgi:ankyrin repeat protein
MDLIRVLLAADVDPAPQLNMHRPSRTGNSGRFIDPLLNTGMTPLVRATMAHDKEVVEALLAKGAPPDINAMGMTAFLVAAGAGPGHVGGTGLAAETSAGGDPDLELMDLLLKHGASVNAQITGTRTYSMRVARAPSANEGFTALHTTVQAGRVDLVRYLLEKGASSEIADHSGRKPIDLAAAATAANTTPVGGGGARGGGGDSAASAAEIRKLLQNAAGPGR